MTHSHGDPGLECTIWDCRHPDERFLCTIRLSDGSCCVLPARHPGEDHENENRVSLVPAAPAETTPRGAPGTTLLGVLIKHAGHRLQSGTRYEIPPGRVYGTPHVTLRCLTCEEPVWDEGLERRQQHVR